MVTHPPIDIIRVFTDTQNKFGNPVGLVLDDVKKIGAIKRQQLAKDCGLSEIVFINDIPSGNLSIYNPQDECPFAMHATLGAAWYISHVLHSPISYIISGNVQTATWEKDDIVWVKARLDVIPQWNLRRMESPDEIENLDRNKLSEEKHLVVWAWLDKDKGTIRARTFASDWGIHEDEANGSGAMRLAEKTQMNLTIFHGVGSVIYANPSGNAYGIAGGHCIQTSI